jgi:RNA polymerase sigma factor (sigma-70 family)
VISSAESARIVDRAATNDEQAWADLVRHYSGMLNSIAAGFRLNRGDAEDAVQMTWTDLVRNIHGLRSHDRVGGWLSTTMRRNCMRILQRHRLEVLTDVIEATVVDESVDIENAVLTAERDQQLWQVVERLPDRQARLLSALFAEDERSYEEIARALSMPIGAIGPIRQRALRSLERLLVAETTILAPTA